MNELLAEGIRTIEEEILSLERLKSRLDSTFIKAVEIISNSNKVVFSGIGKSGLIGAKISATLSSIGVSSIFLHPVEALHGDIGTVQDNDVCVMLSKSGSTEELIKLLPFIKMRKAKIITIVGNINSYLARNSDLVLDASIEREACPFNLAPTSSSTTALALGDALAIAIMKYKKVTLEDFSKLHPLGQIGRNITIKVKDIMHQGVNLPVITKNKMIKDAIIEISNKKLGAVCIVEDEKLLGIITDGDIRRLLTNSENIAGISVEEIMTKEPIRINCEAFVGEALAVMENRDSQISVLPVVDGNNLVGLIRIHDIVKTGV